MIRSESGPLKPAVIVLKISGAIRIGSKLVCERERIVFRIILTVKVSHMQDEAPSSGNVSGMRDRSSRLVWGIKSGPILWFLEKFQISSLFFMLNGKQGYINLNIASKTSGII